MDDVALKDTMAELFSRQSSSLIWTLGCACGMQGVATEFRFLDNDEAVLLNADVEDESLWR